MIPTLRRTILDEIVASFGFSKQGWAHYLLAPLFWAPAHTFAHIGARIDTRIAEKGMPSAAQQLLARFVDDVRVVGKEGIPSEGPLLIASNHPGAYDSIAIVANLPRQDIKVIVSDIPFLQNLPAANRHMIYTPAGVSARMGAVRALIRHLRDGGTALIFPSGKVDPDPDLLPGAEKSLETSSSSLELAIKTVPETRMLVSIVSGVLAPSCLHNPLTRLINEPWRQQKLAEVIQVMQQISFGRKFDLQPRISFGEPMTAAELISRTGSDDLHLAILDYARSVLKQHLHPSPI